MVHARLEKNGRVAFVRGSEVMHVPSEAACRERLITLLESAGGDARSLIVDEFWKERGRDMGDQDDMKREWASETYRRLELIWDDLITPPAEDAFGAFGL